MLLHALAHRGFDLLGAVEREDMLGEGTPRRDRVHFMTPKEIKKRLGRLPRGGDSDEAMFALVELHGGEDLILLLEPADKGWRVIGLDR